MAPRHASRRGTNDIGRKAEPFLHKIEGINSDIEQLKSEFMTKCKGKRKLIRDAYKAAKDEGVPIEPLKGIVKQRALQAKIDKIPVDYDIDEAAAYRDLASAFGPLGQAAAIRAGYGQPAGEAKDANGNGTDEERTPTAAEAKAAQQKRDHEAGLSTVGRGPPTTS